MIESFDKIEIDEILISGKSSDDIGEIVLKDREMLAESGIVIVSTTIDKETKEILSGPFTSTRGFIYVKDNMDILKESEIISGQVIRNYLANNKILDYNAIRYEIREKLGKYFYQEIESRPIIIVIIQEV